MRFIFSAQSLFLQNCSCSGEQNKFSKPALEFARFNILLPLGLYFRLFNACWTPSKRGECPKEIYAMSEEGPCNAHQQGHCQVLAHDVLTVVYVNNAPTHTIVTAAHQMNTEPVVHCTSRCLPVLILSFSNVYQMSVSFVTGRLQILIGSSS